MSRGLGRAQGSEDGRLERVLADVAAALRLRRGEIERTILAYVRDEVPDEVEDLDAEYELGLQSAVAAAVDYGLSGIERGEDWPLPIPTAAIVQARLAARRRVGLDVVMRRYMAGSAVLEDFVMDEVERALAGSGAALRHVRRINAALLGRLIETIAEEHRDELRRSERTIGSRLGERVQALLRGEPVGAGALGYDLDGWHLGAIATGAGAEQTVRGLAAGLGSALLLVACGEDTVWAWFGDRRESAIADLSDRLIAKARDGVCVAVGEPGRGVGGFRLTHRQAQAALLVALRRPQWLTRFADVALLAFALRDDALARSLLDAYLGPLDTQRAGSEVLRETLRAYLLAERNASSAAAALGVARHTVEKRLRRIEQLLGRQLGSCLAELDVALRLEELDRQRPDPEP
jgi:PucR C-terminal helix-turn-helix domain/GGDEF-like domain